jgi:hypothetical protein
MHWTLTQVCFAAIAVSSLILLGYVPGWFRGRAVGRGEQELPTDTDGFWGPEAERASWEPEESATQLMPVIAEQSTVAMQVPTITEVPADTVRFARVPPEQRLSDREWLDKQASLADLVRTDMVRGRVVGGVPEGTMVCTVTTPQPVLSDDTQQFMADMRRRTDEIIARLKAPPELPSGERVRSAA